MIEIEPVYYAQGLDLITIIHRQINTCTTPLPKTRKKTERNRVLRKPRGRMEWGKKDKHKRGEERKGDEWKKKNRKNEEKG